MNLVGKTVKVYLNNNTSLEGIVDDYSNDTLTLRSESNKSLIIFSVLKNVLMIKIEDETEGYPELDDESALNEVINNGLIDYARYVIQSAKKLGLNITNIEDGRNCINVFVSGSIKENEVVIEVSEYEEYRVAYISSGKEVKTYDARSECVFNTDLDAFLNGPTKVYAKKAVNSWASQKKSEKEAIKDILLSPPKETTEQYEVRYERPSFSQLRPVNRSK